MLLYKRKIKKPVHIQFIKKGVLSQDCQRRTIYPPTRDYNDNYIIVKHKRKMVYLDSMDKELHCLVIEP